MKRQTNKKTKERPAIREFDMAWKEYFKNKPRPRSKNEEKKQLEDFTDWYNNVRKQSDTGKTPAQMYEEIYGKIPQKNSVGKSRKLKFEWDENYKEPDELLREADYLINKEKYEKALKCVESVLEIVSDDEIFLMKAEILNDLGRYEEAEQILNKLDKNEDTKAYASFYRSQRYMYGGNFIKAAKFMKEAYEQEPHNFDFVIGVANYLFLENDKYYSEYVEKARKIDKKRTENFLKKFWFKPKELMKEPFVLAVLDCVDRLISENNPHEAEKNLSFLLNYGHYLEKEVIKMIRGLQIECLIMLKNFGEAVIKVEELVKIDKQNPHAYFYKAQILYEFSNFENALKEIDACLKIAEKTIPHPDFYLLKSMILKKQDNDEYTYYENKARELEKGRKVFENAFRDFMDGGV